MNDHWVADTTHALIAFVKKRFIINHSLVLMKTKCYLNKEDQRRKALNQVSSLCQDLDFNYIGS